MKAHGAFTNKQLHSSYFAQKHFHKVWWNENYWSYWANQINALHAAHRMCSHNVSRFFKRAYKNECSSNISSKCQLNIIVLCLQLFHKKYISDMHNWSGSSFHLRYQVLYLSLIKYFDDISMWFWFFSDKHRICIVVLSKDCACFNRSGEINRPSRLFGDPNDCIFHFYLSVDDLNPSGVALFEIQNVVPTCIKYIPNTCEKQPMQCINFSVVWF